MAQNGPLWYHNYSKRYQNGPFWNHFGIHLNYEKLPQCFKSIFFPEIRGEVKQTTNPGPEVTDLEGKGETILLVDDNDSVRGAVASILSLKGYKFIQAKNGLDAVRLIDVKNEKIDLLISDVVMPGMNGRNLARRMRESIPNLEVLLMSGYADASSDSELDTTNIIFMSKPVHTETLLSKARVLLDDQRNAS
ncbi:response regulator [bacterium]|nr:response regulator [bacterium]